MRHPLLHITICLAVSAPLHAQTIWYVDVNGSPPGTGTLGDPFTSIQFAIDSVIVQDGDELSIAAGTYAENLFVDKDLALRGVSFTDVIVDAGGQDRAAWVAADVHLERLTLRNGSSTLGGGVYVDSGMLTASRLVVEDCSADFGGGLYASGASVTLSASSIDANWALQGGGIYTANSSVTLTGVTVSGNRAAGDAPGGIEALGGGIRSDGASLALSSVLIDNNTALIEDIFSHPKGGGLYADGGSVAMTGCILSDNVSGDNFDLWPSGHGGGSYATCQTTFQVGETTYSQNVAGGIPADGGGHRGPGSFTGCTFFGNEAEHGGGLASTGCTLTVDQCDLLGNWNGWENVGGGGVAGPANVTSSLVSGNRSFSRGGGLLSCQVTDCVVVDNEVIGSPFGPFPAEGGGLHSCIATNCHIEGNRVLSQPAASPSDGAGVFGGSAEGCTIVNNVAIDMNGDFSFGGGASQASLTRCVVIGNSADHGAGTSSCDLFHVTVANNTATVGGGGVDNSGSSFDTILNSIIWANSAPNVVPGAVLSVTYSDVEGGWPGSGNLDVDPLFWYPHTFDVHLKPGSPVIDQGDPNTPWDPDNTPPDMGAYFVDPSYAPAPANYCEGNVNSDGCRAVISATGTPTLTGPDDFFLQVDQAIPVTFGIFIWSLAPDDVPFQGATLCIAPPIVRGMPILTSGSGPCGGTASEHLTQALIASTLSGSAYQSAYAQFWYRDTSAPPFFIGLSDALEFTLRP